MEPLSSATNLAKSKRWSGPPGPGDAPQDQATPLWSPEQASMNKSGDISWGAQCVSVCREHRMTMEFYGIQVSNELHSKRKSGAPLLRWAFEAASLRNSLLKTAGWTKQPGRKGNTSGALEASEG